MTDLFAHRGLWSPDGPPENSLAAFRAAATQGVGIELDVTLSSDGVAMVFHDPVLDRMTAEGGPVWTRTADALGALTLAGSAERMPRLADVIAALPPGLPVLVELKTGPAAPDAHAEALADALQAAGTAVALMSFSLDLLAACARHLPERRRGVLFPPGMRSTPDAAASRLEAAKALSAGFLAVHHGDAAHLSGLKPAAMPLLAWTIDSAESLAAAGPHADGLIFEHLEPGLVRNNGRPR